MSSDVTVDELLTPRRVLVLAWPIILANIAVPLLGVVDTAVIGHLGAAAPLGAIAIGAQIFAFLYWGMGFLRMGTTGLTAQADGAGDEAEVRAILGRALVLGIAVGCSLVVLQRPVIEAALFVFPSNPEVGGLARDYVLIRIWGAPATMASYTAIGWFIGLRATRVVMLLQVFMNLLNMALDVFFVVGLGWGVRGVALGTLISEWSAAGLAVVVIVLHLRRRPGRVETSRIMDPKALLQMLRVNQDIFLRTLLLIGAFAWFTRQGARAGEAILAANHVLLQFLVFSAFFLDGFAFSTEALVGQAVGRSDRLRLVRVVRLSTALAVATSVLTSLVFALIGPAIISAMTNVAVVRQTAQTFLWYVVLLPVVGVWCFQLDGIFIGATRTRAMRNSMVVSFLVYLGLWWLLWEPLANHGLWLAFISFFVVRGITLGIHYPGLVRSVGDDSVGV